jgi:hypothetical protein
MENVLATQLVLSYDLRRISCLSRVQKTKTAVIIFCKYHYMNQRVVDVWYLQGWSPRPRVVVSRWRRSTQRLWRAGSARIWAPSASHGATKNDNNYLTLACGRGTFYATVTVLLDTVWYWWAVLKQLLLDTRWGMFCCEYADVLWICCCLNIFIIGIVC